MVLHFCNNITIILISRKYISRHIFYHKEMHLVQLYSEGEKTI